MSTSLIVVSYIIFLVIFSLTAVITLLSLINVLKMDDKYRWKLFIVLIVEVIGVVIGILKSATTDSKTSPITGAKLTDIREWKSEYAEKAWLTKSNFISTDSGLYFHGTTWYLNTRILDWQSIEPIKITDLVDKISFSVRRTILPGFAAIDSTMKFEVGKTEVGAMKLQSDFSLTGGWIGPRDESGWGFQFTRVWQ